MLPAAALALAPIALCAQESPAPSPGPCEQPGAIGAIVDRPGLGRPTANNGSPCVVPASQAVIETGYREQMTTGSGGTSTLANFPLPLLRIGLGARSEVVVQPPAQSVRGGAALGGTFVPAIGPQDVGLGLKRMLHDGAGFQDAVELFATAPTGRPLGASGFSAGAPTWTLSYTAALPLTKSLGLSITQNAIANAAPVAPSGAIRFFSYQPSVTVSYGFTPAFTVLVSDQITTPLAPGAGTGNRALLAVQRVLSPNVVLDAEYEVNALPAAPAVRQHAFGIGGAVML